MTRWEAQFLLHAVNVEQPCPAVATGPQSVKRAEREGERSLNETLSKSGSHGEGN
jgi:hypothetical protein